MKDVEELEVFKLAHTLVLEIYRVTQRFPQEERFGLVSQMRAAASSVPTNLVEGANRNSTGEYKNFVGIAKGSAGEVRYQLRLAHDLQYLSREEADRLRGEYKRVLQMLERLRKALV